MTSFVHVPAGNMRWSTFVEEDATHEQLAVLSTSLASDAVWLLRRSEEPRATVAPTQAGVYRMDPGTFEFESPGDEICYVIAGAADVVVAADQAVTLRAGDMIFWPRGIRTSWTIIEPFVQFFTMVG